MTFELIEFSLFLSNITTVSRIFNLYAYYSLFFDNQKDNKIVNRAIEQPSNQINYHDYLFIYWQSNFFKITQSW